MAATSLRPICTKVGSHNLPHTIKHVSMSATACPSQLALVCVCVCYMYLQTLLGNQDLVCQRGSAQCGSVAAKLQERVREREDKVFISKTTKTVLV